MKHIEICEYLDRPENRFHVSVRYTTSDVVCCGQDRRCIDRGFPTLRDAQVFAQGLNYGFGFSGEQVPVRNVGAVNGSA